nr:AT-rich interactive domain-containing protein 5 isoform X1 [Ipomoea trifida]
MGNNDVEIQDTEMQSQGVGKNEQGLDKKQVDADVKPEIAELPPSASVDEPKSSGLEQQHNEIITEAEDKKNEQDGTTGDSDESKAENEEGDQCKANVEGQREAGDEIEQNTAKTEIEDNCYLKNEADEKSNAGNEVKDQTNAATDDPSKPRDEGDQNIAESDSKDVIMGGKEEPHLIENGEDKILTCEALEDKEANDDAAKGETLSENAQLPDEQLTNQVPEDTKGGMRGLAHDGENDIPQNGNEMMIEEKKEPEDKTTSASVIDVKDASLGEASETKKKVNYIPENLDKLVGKCARISLVMSRLWKAVIRLGGYDRVTGSKLWRQVGESFNPPKTCTTVSWTFRIFYEKALLEYERHKIQTGELQLSIGSLPDPSGVDNEQIFREMAIKLLDQAEHEEMLLPVLCKDGMSNAFFVTVRLVTTVVDVGPPADWVKINVRETKDCFEVYALVPGLLREEVRVQSDPAGRLVITGQPEQLDNPWGITAFKKVVSLPARIDPLQTSAVVSLHGRLFVRVPFEQSNM